MESQRHRITKIIVTLGIHSSSQEELVQLIHAGMDVARISDRFLLTSNKTEVLRNLKAAMAETGKQVGVMLSLRESDIRFKTPEAGGVLQLHEGDIVKVVTDLADVVAGEKAVLCNNKEFPLLVKPNDKLLIDFGKIIFTVIDVENSGQTQASMLNGKTRDNIIYKLNASCDQQIKIEAEVGSMTAPAPRSDRPMRIKPKSPRSKHIVVCRVENECTFWAHKPVHISPSDAEAVPPVLSITHEAEDIKAIEWANENDIDFVVYKQVREKDDLVDMLRFSVPNAKKFVGIQSKEASDIYPDLLRMADGIVIGRGSLALETSLAHVCQLQKDITLEANSCGKPVIISTQILESMVYSARPGVTEALDVTNAVIDGCDGFVLTAETAYGLNPVRAVQACVSLCLEAEAVIDYERENEKMLRGMSSMSIIENICYCAVRSVLSIQAHLIACITNSGATALMISHFRPPCPILAITNRQKTVRQLRIIRGVFPAYCDETARLDIALVNVAMEVAVRDGLAKSGDVFVYVSGGHDFQAGDTSSLRICKVP